MFSSTPGINRFHIVIPTVLNRMVSVPDSRKKTNQSVESVVQPRVTHSERTSRDSRSASPKPAPASFLQQAGEPSSTPAMAMSIMRPRNKRTTPGLCPIGQIVISTTPFRLRTGWPVPARVPQVSRAFTRRSQRLSGRAGALVPFFSGQEQPDQPPPRPASMRLSPGAASVCQSLSLSVSGE